MYPWVLVDKRTVTAPVDPAPDESLLNRFWVGASSAVLFGIGLGTLTMFGILLIRATFSGDFPWILRAGEYILDHGALPTHDIFSWSMADKPWILYQWLFEVLVALGYRVLGEQGLAKTFFLLVGTLYILVPLWRFRKTMPSVLTFPMAGLAAVCAMPCLSIRPAVMTSVCLLLQFLLLEQLRKQRLGFKPFLAMLFGLYMLWGNLHLSVSVGLLFLGLCLIGDWLQQHGFYPYQGEESPECLPWHTYFPAMIVGFVASCINPYGPLIYTYQAKFFHNPFLYNVILELKSPDFHSPLLYPLLILIGSVMLLLPVAHKVLRARECLLLMFFSLYSLLAVRIMSWFAMVWVLIYPPAFYRSLFLHPKIRAWTENLFSNRVPYGPLITVFLGVGLIGFLFFPAYIPPPRHVDCEVYQRGITRYHDIRKPTDKPLMTPMIGSCSLLYFPHDKIFFDTRFDFYAPPFVKDVLYTFAMAGDWEAFLDRWQIDTAVLDTNCYGDGMCPLLEGLRRQKGYHTVYEDKHMVILQKPES